MMISLSCCNLQIPFVAPRSTLFPTIYRAEYCEFAEMVEETGEKMGIAGEISPLR